MHKDTEALLRRLRKAGFIIADRGSSHRIVTHPERVGVVIVARTCSDHRALANIRADVRRVFNFKL